MAEQEALQEGERSALHHRRQRAREQEKAQMAPRFKTWLAVGGE